MSGIVCRETVVIASKNQVAAEMPGEVVILDVAQGEYYGLSAVGAKIWSFIQEARRVSDVCSRVMEEYPDVDRERCERDTTALIQELVDVQLAEIRSDAGESLAS